MIIKKKLLLIATLFSLFIFSNCSKKSSPSPSPTLPPVIPVNDVDLWLTKGDQSVLLQKQTGILSFGTTINSYPSIDVDANTTFQSMDGFGFTLTGGSAYLINRMGVGQSSALLTELFGNGINDIGINFYESVLAHQI
ncbi:MAG: hypothetical protein ACOYLO_10305 [Ferruginibacter sp.]